MLEEKKKEKKIEFYPNPEIETSYFKMSISIDVYLQVTEVNREDISVFLPAYPYDASMSP